MPFLWATHRTIVYEAVAQEEIDDFTDPHHRFHDQLMGVEWILARTPEIGTPATPDDRAKNVLLVFQGDELAGTTDLWLLYSYDEGEVIVHGLKVADV